MKNIAIIPARGGSKRLPRKNILPVGGKPMLSYSVMAAIESGLFDDVIVSTEDNEIAEVACGVGATVVQRPCDLAQDQSTVVQVCKHVLSLPKYEAVEIFCCIYATAVLLKSEDLIKSNKLLGSKSQVDFVMGVSQYNYHPVQALKGSNGYLQSMWPEYKTVQSQFYPDLVVSNGTLYWARKDTFLKSQTFYGDRLLGYIFPPERALDIDTLEDWKRAELMYQMMIANGEIVG